MKLNSIFFKPSCLITFTREEVELLMALSALHYDAHCREVGQVGGFLFGLNNVYVVCEPIAIAASGADINGVTLSFRQIDTLCKILESGYAVTLPASATQKQRATYKQSLRLGECLRDCLQSLNNVSGLTQEVR